MITNIIELDKNILRFTSIEVLKQICFFNESIYNIILKDKEFWCNKFEYERLLQWNKSPSFKQYIKINQYKQQAKEILLVNDIQYQTFKYNIRTRNIVMIVKQDTNLIKKLFSDIIMNDIEKYRIGITIVFDNNSVQLKIKFFTDDHHKYIFRITTYEEIINLLTNCLYRNIDICDERGCPFHDYRLNNDHERLTIANTLKYFDHDIINSYHNKLRGQINSVK